MSYLFQLPTKIIFGIDTVNDLGKEISRYSANKALIITDPGVVKAGIHEILISCLKTNKIGYEIFSAVEPDPSIDTAIRAAEAAKTFRAQVLVALGGGSAIDTAKSAALLSVNNEDLKFFAGVDKVKKAGLPVIAIPTTAGTGSEATIFAVMSDLQNNDKFTISSPLIAPRVAILDPALTATLPPAVTAYTGMDALTHAVEAYSSVIAQPATDAFALKAIDLIMHNLRVAVGRGDNLKARENMLQGALLAGIAFNNAYLGLSHAIASPLGGHFHIAHGLANAIMLPYVMKYNVLTAADKYAAISKVSGLCGGGATGHAAALGAVEAVENLAKDINIPVRLRHVGAKEDLLPLVARDALKSIQLKFNPRTASEEDILALLQKAY